MTRNIVMTMTAAAFMALMPLASVHAQSEDVKKEIRALFSHKAEILTGERIDVDRALAEAKKYNRDDAVFINRLKNLETGKVSENKMTKADMIAQMPRAYSMTINNKADIDVTSIEHSEQKYGWDVHYDLDYNALLQQRDVYGRIISTDMAMTSTCTDHIARNAMGVLQTVHSECDAEIRYNRPQVEVELSNQGGAQDKTELR